MSAMSRRGSTLGYEGTLMYGQYKEDLSQFAQCEARRCSTVAKHFDNEAASKKRQTQNRCSGCMKRVADFLSHCWTLTFGRIGEDWMFLALLGIIMALLSYLMDRVIFYCSFTRIALFKMSGDDIMVKYLTWTLSSMVLILFATGFVHLVAPQAAGSGIPEIKTIQRGVILTEYLTFKTLVAKMVGLTFTLGSGMPLGKEGPFVHIASIVATLLSKLITTFNNIYENESRSGEMLAAAAAIGVASTFYSPIGGVLFSIEVTSVYFAVRNYWRGFFAACCGATVWRLLGVWIHAKEMTITALFKTHFRSDFPFDVVELFVFALIGVMCGFAGAGYVFLHRQIVHFNRKTKWLNNFFQKNRFLYPAMVTFIIASTNFPDFAGKYMAAEINTHDQIEDLFANKTWYLLNSSDPIFERWSTSETGVLFHLPFFIFMTGWSSALASTMPVPSGLFIPVFKMGAAFGRLVGEIMALIFPNGISFAGHMNPIVPGGYAVVGAAAFSGAVTHTISTTVIVFELTGQLSHIIPVIIAVLIANAIAQSLYPSIYDSIIQIKKLPFLPNINSASSAAHSVFVEDIMIPDVVFVWLKCTYNDIRKILRAHKQIQSFPLLDSPQSMILLGSIQRQELQLALSRFLSKERRLLEIERREQQAKAAQEAARGRRTSRFNVDPVEKGNGGLEVPTSRSEASSPDALITVPIKPIIKSSGLSCPAEDTGFRDPHSDSRIRQAFDHWFRGSKLSEQVGRRSGSYSAPCSPSGSRRVRLSENRFELSPEELLRWEEEKLREEVDFSALRIDPAPFQLVEHTSLIKVHSLFSMLQLNHTYVTSIGKLIGVVALKDIRVALEKLNSGTFQSRKNSRFYISPTPDSAAETSITLSVFDADHEVTEKLFPEGHKSKV